MSRSGLKSRWMSLSGRFLRGEWSVILGHSLISRCVRGIPSRTDRSSICVAPSTRRSIGMPTSGVKSVTCE